MSDDVAEYAAEAEREVRAIRQAGDFTAIATAGLAAVAAIRRRAAGDSAQDRAALTAAKRLAYNAAADCWPGWSEGTVVAPAVLEAARALAVQSADLVTALALPPFQAGNAAWLIGAFDLALGCLDAALANFAAAEQAFGEAGAPDMVLMAKGYAELAREAAGAATGGLEQILDDLRASSGEDGKALADQLVTARNILLGQAKTAPLADVSAAAANEGE